MKVNLFQVVGAYIQRKMDLLPRHFTQIIIHLEESASINYHHQVNLT